jgi:putative SOS response-associated peptidase YedK
MCGRYTRFTATELIYRHFDIEPLRPEPAGSELAPSWNVTPQTMQPVIRRNPVTNKREMVLMRWGLVPSFAESPIFNFSTINARAETLLTKPAFREPFRRRRCLVPVSSYYEWQALDSNGKKKQAWAIGLKSEEPFALGGIWERWVSPDRSVELESYSIITVEPNQLLAFMHHRMPLILAPAYYNRWLEPGDPQRPPVDLLRSYDDEQMKIWRVKPDVGNVRNNRPDLIDPAEPPEDPPMLF